MKELWRFLFNLDTSSWFIYYYKLCFTKHLGDFI